MTRVRWCVCIEWALGAGPGTSAKADVLPGRIADGARSIAFLSADPTLIPADDTNEGKDAFVRHLR